MTELLPWITGAGGALVVLTLWVYDLRSQRAYERQRVSELTDRFTASTTAGNDAIRDLTDAVLDATDAVIATNTGQSPPRRRPPRVR